MAYLNLRLKKKVKDSKAKQDKQKPSSVKSSKNQYLNSQYKNFSIFWESFHNVLAKSKITC